MITSGKQFKILNSNKISVLHIQADIRGRNFFTGVKIDYFLKSQENFFRSLVESIELKQVQRLVVHSKSFDYEIQKLPDVAKEHHDIFFEQMTNMKESVDRTVAELKSKMSKEIDKMEKNYTLVHSKVDAVASAITRLVDFKTNIDY